MKRVCAPLLALLIVSPALSHAEPILPGAPDSVPLLFACVNDECRNLSDLIQRIPTGDKLLFSVNTGILQFAAATVVLTMFGDPDPFITFGATTTNFVPGPVSYAFLFGIPVVPASYNHATSTGGVTVTNGASGTTTVDNSIIYPTYISGYGSLAAVPTNLGVDLGTAACVASGTPFTVTTVCSQGTLANSFAPTLYDNLEALLTYTQDDVASVASWSGAVTLTDEAVAPEPTLLTLVGSAIVAYGFRRRRRR